MNAPLPPDPYKALGVDSNANAANIKTAYRKLVLKCHPDKFPDPTLKALKQEEFQRVQQAYEILGNEDKKKEYDLEVQAKRLKEELNKRGGSTTNGPTGGRYNYNVHVRTAEPPPGWSPSSKHSPPKSSSHKPYSGLFSQSWENEIPSRSKTHYEEGRTARRAASYEKPKREDSRDRRRRFEEDRERERRREQDEEDMKRERRQKLAKERELRDRDSKERERERERARKAREREDRDSRAREHEREARLKADAKMEKKRERERAEREAAKRKQDADEKTRAKTKPYVEHSGFSDDEDTRKSPSKKPSKKHDSPTREKPSSKQRERLGSRDEGLIGDKNQSADDKLQSAMAFAAQYVQETKNKANKSPPKVAQDMPAYSAAYPDPNEKFAAAAKRRGSGDGKHVKGEPIIVDAPGPSKERTDTANVSPTQQAPPRLQKSYTMPPGHMPQVQPAAATRGPPGLNRSYTMQPDHFDGAGRSSGEKHRSSRRRASFNEDDYLDDRHSYPQIRKFSVSRDKGAAPRTMEAKYKDPYGPSPGASFPKVKTAPNYGPEHVSTAKRYGNDEVLTSDYSQPTYTDYPTQAAY